MDNKVAEEKITGKKKIHLEISTIIILLAGFILFKAVPLFWNNVEVSVLWEFCSSVMCHYPILLGAMASFITWHIMYFDSATPGEDPPSPLSPTKYRKKSDANLHLNYIFALTIGPLATLLLYTEII